MTRDTVIFDLGGVLVDWNPRHLFRKMFDGDDAAMEHFLDNVCTMAWHAQHDAGKSFVDTRAQLKAAHPGFVAQIDAFGDRHLEMFGGAIAPTVLVLEQLARRRVPLFALTNFPAETFPWARENFRFLDHFRDIVVSGVERVMKPDPKIFQLLLTRNRIRPEQAVYIDDSARNVAVANGLGMHGIHFRSAEELDRELRGFGLLG